MKPSPNNRRKSVTCSSCMQKTSSAQSMIPVVTGVIVYEMVVPAVRVFQLNGGAEKTCAAVADRISPAEHKNNAL